MSDLPDDTLPISIVAYTITSLPIDIVAQTIGNIAIDIAAQSVGNLNVNLAASAITLNVNIESQTVDINIKTSGGANIMIDKLTQSAYTEDRRTLSNNGATASWRSVVSGSRKGKFFPRGCRGFIDTIDVYCRDSGVSGGTITVYISPHPEMGETKSATITIPAAGAASWRSANFDAMWNYDSLFIFVVCSSSDIQFGEDTGTPYDGYHSNDNGETWTHQNYRYWFKAVLKGETVGDLPVSGIINAIPLPSVTQERFNASGSLPRPGTVTLKTIRGSGELLYVYFRVQAGTDSHLTAFTVQTDGNMAVSMTFQMLDSYGFTASTPGISKLSYAANGECIALVTLRLPFRKKLVLGMQSSSGAGGNLAVDIDGTCKLIT